MEFELGLKGPFWVEISSNAKGTIVMPSIIWNFSKFSHSNALVKICVICNDVENWLRWMVFISIWCRIKWYLVFICLVQSWNMGFFSNWISKVLSTVRGVEFIYFSYKSWRIFLSHIISLVAWAATIYYVSILEIIVNLGSKMILPRKKIK